MPIEVVLYDPTWPMRFARIRAELDRALDDVAVRAIEHVGSTSVPGLAAKPVIDIDVVVLGEQLEAAIDALVTAGYEHRGELGIPGRHAMRAPADGVRRNVYVVVEGSLAMRNHFTLRTALRADRALARAYGELKMRLADATDDLDTYVEAKSDLIMRILANTGFSAAELDAIRAANAVAADEPPSDVLMAFDVSGEPRRLGPGAWSVGDVMLKRSDVSPAWLKWEQRVLASVIDLDFRIQRMRMASDGRLMVNGWIARDFLRGDHRRPHWSAVLEVAKRLNRALADVSATVSQPLPMPRADAWTRADRMAWEDAPIPRELVDSIVAELVALRRPVTVDAQIVHGDLTGNVLFDAELSPAVIDFSPYVRPAAYALAVVVADAVVWHDAETELVEHLKSEGDGYQALVRAMLFRHLTALLLNRGVPGGAAGRRYAKLRRIAAARIT